jgi:NTP pyrophosphatase (non-canonical NTP hydrolase)
MNQPAAMTITEFQELIRSRYFATDSARGAPATFLWFAEEVGELAEAIAHRERGDGDQSELAGEFADVLAWLTTLANITGVDLESALRAKYLEGGGPTGTK